MTTRDDFHQRIDSLITRFEAGELVFSRQVISDEAEGATSVVAIDLDGDSFVDVLSSSRTDGKIAWYRNDGNAAPRFPEHEVTS